MAGCDRQGRDVHDEQVKTFIQATAARLTADGCQVHTEDWNGSTVTIGCRSDFRIRWMATRLHLFTILAPAEMIRQSDLEGFTDTAFDYVNRQKGQLRGLQNGIGVFPCLVSTRVDPAAAAWAKAQQRTRFAMLARPVVANVYTGETACFLDNSALGIIYSSHLRTKLKTYFSL